MKKMFLGLGVATMASAGVVTVTASRHETTIRPNTYVGGVNLGGMPVEEAQKTVRVWWEGERVKKLILKSPYLTKSLPGMTPGQLGVTIDDVATVAKLPTLELVDDLTSKSFDVEKIDPVFKSNGAKPVELEQAVKTALPAPHPAMVKYYRGQIVRKPEIGGLQLDEPKLIDAVTAALKDATPVQLPVKEADKRITDAQLAAIQEVVAEFTTRFPLRRNRVENIRVAASKLNGVVLLPGEKLSFNDTVGRRTIAAGFRTAPVFLNGKHDLGVGGGICQVSTTLYNASLFADLKIVKRRNHSMPVPYVPLGRDATVDYGSTDLVIENSYPNPIAVSSYYTPGALTFRILGKKIPGQFVKILRGPVKTWAPPQRTVVDATLPEGKKKVVQPGTSGHSTSTTRVVYLNGVVVKRESLGRSYYAGGPRIVAVGSKPATPIVVPPPAQPTVTTPPVVGAGLP